MSRVPLDKHALKIHPIRDLEMLSPVSGARLYVYDRGTTDEAIGYTTEEGSTQVTYPLISNSAGEFLNAWYGVGDYDLYSPDDILNPTQPWGVQEGPVGPQGPVGLTGPQGPGTFNFNGDIIVEAGAMGGIHPVTDYGAVGDGTTDDTNAVQAAITYVTQHGGTVYFPPGTYKITSPLLVARNSKTMRLAGPGPANSAGSGGATLYYTAATGSCIRWWSNWGVEMYGLGFKFDSNFTGDLIDIDGDWHDYPPGSGSGWYAADVQNFSIHHCSSICTGGWNNNSVIRLHKAIIGEIHRNQWTCGDSVIQLSIPDNNESSYVNAVYIHDNTYNWCTDCFIKIASLDCEGCVIEKETFEGNSAIRGTTTAEDGGGNGCWHLTVKDCWIGDLPGAGDFFMKGLSGHGSISHNMIWMGSLNDKAFRSFWGSWTFHDNRVDSGDIFGDDAGAHSWAATRVTTISNHFSPANAMNERQSIIATGGTAGDFTLTFDTQTTGSIAYDATASAVQSALEALSNIDPGEVSCTGGPLPNTAVVVEFVGGLGATELPLMTVVDNITGGDATVTRLTWGHRGGHIFETNEPANWVSLADNQGTQVGMPNGGLYGIKNLGIGLPMNAVSNGDLDAIDNPLVIGCNASNPIPVGEDRAYIYWGMGYGPASLAIQTPGHDAAHANGYLKEGAGGTTKFRWNPDGVGFNGEAPSKPNLTYSRSGESAAEAALRSALATLGLVTDNTTA